MERVEQRNCFGGSQEVWKHTSESLNCEMKFGVYLPPGAGPFGVLYFLSGLTCTEQNFLTKAGAQRYAAELGVIIVAPDTSPRGDDVPDADGYDLGKGAGFYVNATQEPWSRHYQMYDYVTAELPALVDAHFATTGVNGIAGHSMGGHGALVLGLRNPQLYASISAISPIVAPTQVPWGKKAFSNYLGDDTETWKAWDACELVREAQDRRLLFVDQGTGDEFLAEQLQTDRLLKACTESDYPLNLREHVGYDHGYYFIATVIGEHVAHHAAAMR